MVERFEVGLALDGIYYDHQVHDFIGFIYVHH